MTLLLTITLSNAFSSKYITILRVDHTILHITLRLTFQRRLGATLNRCGSLRAVL